MKQLPFTLRPSLTKGQTSLPVISTNNSLKTFLFLLSFISIATTSSGQQLDSIQHPKSSIDLLQKSKAQKTWGWILTSVGVVGLVFTYGAETGETWIEAIGGEEEDLGNYTAPYVLSAAAIAGGITLFVAAAKNKKRSAASVVYLKMEDATALKSLGFNQKSFPSLALRFKLSR